jgi:hypothetical protein
MDPNANLKEQREVVARLIDDNYERASQKAADAYRLAELVNALDGWLEQGGSLPSDWQKGRA